MIMDLKQTCVLYIVDFTHVLMYDAKLRIIQSYEQVLVPMDWGPTVHGIIRENTVNTYSLHVSEVTNIMNFWLMYDNCPAKKTRKGTRNI